MESLFLLAQIAACGPILGHAADNVSTVRFLRWGVKEYNTYILALMAQFGDKWVWAKLGLGIGASALIYWLGMGDVLGSGVSIALNSAWTGILGMTVFINWRAGSKAKARQKQP